jgi:beta-glucosidase-like glycosyl hydrolase
MKDGRGVLATAKHYVGDGGTRRGIDQGVTQASPADLANVHGAGYLGALDAGVLTVMTSFSSWTDSAGYVEHGKMHGNAVLMTGVLKERLAFDGLIVSDWVLATDLTLKVTVPANTTATVHVPAMNEKNVSADGAAFVRSEAGRQIYAIGSGTYQFVAKGGPAAP